jgi:hypothetical protein
MNPLFTSYDNDGSSIALDLSQITHVISVRGSFNVYAGSDTVLSLPSFHRTNHDVNISKAWLDYSAQANRPKAEDVLRKLLEVDGGQFLDGAMRSILIDRLEAQT